MTNTDDPSTGGTYVRGARADLPQGKNPAESHEGAPATNLRRLRAFFRRPCQFTGPHGRFAAALQALKGGQALSFCTECTLDPIGHLPELWGGYLARLCRISRVDGGGFLQRESPLARARRQWPIGCRNIARPPAVFCTRDHHDPDQVVGVLQSPRETTRAGRDCRVARSVNGKGTLTMSPWLRFAISFPIGRRFPLAKGTEGVVSVSGPPRFG
jgi:hypothetical protein